MAQLPRGTKPSSVGLPSVSREPGLPRFAASAQWGLRPGSSSSPAAGVSEVKGKKKKKKKKKKKDRRAPVVPGEWPRRPTGAPDRPSATGTNYRECRRTGSGGRVGQLFPVFELTSGRRGRHRRAAAKRSTRGPVYIGSTDRPGFPRRRRAACRARESCLFEGEEEIGEPASSILLPAFVPVTHGDLPPTLVNSADGAPMVGGRAQPFAWR